MSKGSKIQVPRLQSRPWKWDLGVGGYFFLLGLYGQEEVREPPRLSAHTVALSFCSGRKEQEIDSPSFSRNRTTD
jgi:hypothetical protein